MNTYKIKYIIRLRSYLLLQLTFMLLLSGCSVYKTGNYSFLFSLLSALPNDTVLKIKTYDGSGMVVHPDIIYNENTSKKGEFILSLTPYPHFNDSLENPCIYKSTDGINFIEPFSGLNPIVPAPANYKKNRNHNDDPDIFYDSRKKIYRIIYLNTMMPDKQFIKLISSADLLHWKESEILTFDLSNKEKFIVSPSIVAKGSKLYMFYVNKKTEGKYTVEFMKSRNIKGFRKNNATDIKIDLPADITPWHLDIIRNLSYDKHNSMSKKYYMLLNAFAGHIPEWNDNIQNQYLLFLAESNDLLKWKVKGKLIDCTDIKDNDCRYVYRSTGLMDNNMLVVWYSYTTWKPEWKIGLKKFDINKIK